MTIASFDLLQPRSLEEAVALLQQYGDDSRPLGGGTTLIILLKQRVVRYRVLVDLQSIPDLADIRRDPEGVRIGALATHRKVETSELIRESFPALAYAFSQIGNVRVRQTASVGGNLAHGDYRLDPPPPLLVLNAAVHLFGPDGARTVRIREFFTGTYETALRPGELVTSITVPFAPANSRANYLRYSALSANDWPCLGVAAYLSSTNGRCQELRLALGGLAPTPLLIDRLDFVIGQALDRPVVDKVLDTIDEQISPVADLRGSEWYKRRMARVFVKKALDQLNGHG